MIEGCHAEHCHSVSCDRLSFAPDVSPQQLDTLKSAADALGVNQIKTLAFTGSGATFSVGQNFEPNDPWPRVTLKRYTALINYETGGTRQELLREMGAMMPRGGGVPFTGEVHQIQAIIGQYAWNIPIPRSGGWFLAGWTMHASRGGRHPTHVRTCAGESACVHAYALGRRHKAL